MSEVVDDYRSKVERRIEEEKMIKLGSFYKDRITGFEGIATARTEYLNGCVSVLLQPKGLDKEGKIADSDWFDIQRLVDDSKIEVGGPGPILPVRPAN